MKIEVHQCDACHARYETGDSRWTLSGHLTDAFGSRYEICQSCIAALGVNAASPNTMAEGR